MIQAGYNNDVNSLIKRKSVNPSFDSPLNKSTKDRTSMIKSSAINKN